MPERSNAGDPARLLQLLWRTGSPLPPRGPRQGLSADAVVAVSVGLADGEGLGAVTMRRIASLLQVAPMTLYTYVCGKADLLDLMLDAVYAEMPLAGTAGRPWRERVEAVATANKAMFERHPWAAAVSTSRPPLGPGLMAKYEHELAAFDGLGLTDIEMDAALVYLLNFVRSNARDVAAARAIRQNSAIADEQWWATNEPLLARVLDPHTYPLATRIGTAAGSAQGGAYNPDHAYEFGLRRVFDGLAALIEQGV